jgi:hypothetical protein
MYFFYMVIIEQLYPKGDWVILIRMHPTDNLLSSNAPSAFQRVRKKRPNTARNSFLLLNC